MTKNTISKLMFATAMVVPLMAQATDGTIDFTGSLTATTCVVQPVSASFAVQLPALPTSSMTTTKTTAGVTPFSITVKGCSTGAAFKPYFESGTGVDAATGNLNNTGSAKNVQLRLLNTDGSTINAAAVASAQGVNAVTVDATGNATANYAVAYYSENGNATAGTVVGKVAYSVVYQ
ncbi:fimbrial protein [Rhodoferax aquaticus]|uniref:Type 1 fimbrial protein n=1 Tax=Rhodoferax aquaticus TaxID=2527691 RepID=A0A515ESX5_9BURK|nr:fimbrial protein [Rhodoferax aquaticus]QDL55769.1 type 1 fimbrial protein [Rhodoferax aquaticus]